MSTSVPVAHERYNLVPLKEHPRILCDEQAHIQRKLVILKYRANTSVKLSLSDRFAPIEHGYSLQPVSINTGLTYSRPVRLVPFVDSRSVCDSNNNIGDKRNFASSVKTDQERADTMWMNIGGRVSDV
ncbi:hypothetical protein PMAYCL1PPCAC_20977 [Pristionchus mayeri]|uniref:Uncharacterized protein n=1 Tax=Pristionchus mayeri TaxID=1317129 RepID=A0AAN5CVH4_9BILA|nr:hypothetical protein PMAYCL1PPCAC_20977 [Pristionchus mayeri]